MGKGERERKRERERERERGGGEIEGCSYVYSDVYTAAGEEGTS